MGRLERVQYKVIRRRGRNRFVCRWWDDDHEAWREKVLKATRRRDAEKLAEEFVDSLPEDDNSVSPETWLGFLDKYETEKGPSLDSLSIWRSATKKFYILMQPELLTDVTPAMLSAFEARMRSDGLSAATIETYLKYIRASLNWAARLELIEKAPRVVLPPNRGRTARGRAVTGEELDRWLSKLRKDVGERRWPSWEHLMRGLWLSGLRLGESLDLWWDRIDLISVVNLDGRRPVMYFPAGYHKARRDTTCPLTPDFVEFLRATKDRKGPVFSPMGTTRGLRSPDNVCRVISRAGSAAKIVVAREGSTVHYATAHDLRRSFGDRWALRVMPVVLKELMRHRSLETTMKYYVGRSAELTADVVWAAHATVTQVGDILG